MRMPERYELVHTMTDYYDGPREGVADFEGAPHVYASEWSDRDDDWADTFLLSPITSDLFRLAMEDWEIWRRWESAFHEGRATRETHPALPEDRARHDELRRLLADQLSVDTQNAVRARAQFRRRTDSTWSGLGWAPLEVAWERVLQPELGRTE